MATSANNSRHYSWNLRSY